MRLLVTRLALGLTPPGSYVDKGVKIRQVGKKKPKADEKRAELTGLLLC